MFESFYLFIRFSFSTTEDPNILNEAVLEAKKWFQEKKGGLSSVAELAHGTCNLNSAVIDHVSHDLSVASIISYSITLYICMP